MDRFREHLDTLGIGQVAEWDVLAFIYRHGTSLASADQISRLLGYNRAIVGAALETLTLTGLVQRSRNSHGVRLYRFAGAIAGDSRRDALEELMKVAEERQGRLRRATLAGNRLAHILTAAARAFGSREPDASVRDPDWSPTG